MLEQIPRDRICSTPLGQCSAAKHPPGGAAFLCSLWMQARYLERWIVCCRVPLKATINWVNMYEAFISHQSACFQPAIHPFVFPSNTLAEGLPYSVILTPNSTSTGSDAADSIGDGRPGAGSREVPDFCLNTWLSLWSSHQYPSTDVSQSFAIFDWFHY